MPAIHIREVPEDVIEILKKRAARNHRSLQKELRHILDAVVRNEPPVEQLPPIRLHLSKAVTKGTWSRDDIYDDEGR